MTLTATVICLALTAGLDQPTTVELTPSPQPAPSSVVSFDALPPVVEIADDVRVKRFLGAFTGGVVGLGAAMALTPLGDGLCFGASCFSFIHGLVSVFAPLLAITGAWAGFELMGGDGGLATSVIALAPALLVALGMLGIAAQMGSDSSLSLMPALITTGVVFAGVAALALDTRARQLNGLGGAASWGKATSGRVAMTALISLLTTSGAALVSGLMVPLGGYGAGSAILLGVAALAGGVGVAAATWGVHRAMNGRGSFLSALTGMGVGMLVTLGGLGLYAISQSSLSFSPLRSTSGILLAFELGAMAALFSPMLALELSHTNAIEASLPRFSVGAAPTPNGGMVAAGMRF